MKILLSGSTILLLLFITTLENGLSSCTKDKTIYDTVTVVHKDTVTVIQTDTLIIKDTAITTELLSAHPWQMQEIRGVAGGSIVYYLRGGSGNTQNLDLEYITFNADKTGLYVDGNGFPRSITWDFTDSTNTKLIWTIYNTPATFSITWDNIRFKNNSHYLDEYHTDGNNETEYHNQEIRVPKTN